MRPKMYDAIHVNIPAIVGFNPKIVGGYATGTPDIKWIPTDWNLFSGEHVVIDQSGGAARLGGPVESANVMDVEPFCYTVDMIPGWTSHCTAPVPTVYCDRNDLPDVQAIWNGAVWLAAPGLSDTQAMVLMAADPRIVAVQNVQNSIEGFDSSVVGDPFWPNLPPVVIPPVVKGKEMFHGTVKSGSQEDIAFPVDTFDAICLYANQPAGGMLKLTIVLNAGAGESTSTINLGPNSPVTIQFPHPHAVAVSLFNPGITDVGWTLVSD